MFDLQPLSLAGFWKLLSQVEERGGWWVAEIGGRRAHTAKTEREKVPHPRFKQSCPNLAWVCLQVELSVGFASVTPVQLSRKDPPETVGMLSKEGGFTGLNSAHFEMLVATWGPFLPAHSLGTKIGSGLLAHLLALLARASCLTHGSFADAPAQLSVTATNRQLQEVKD